MDKSKKILSQIHNLNPLFNKIFSVPLFIISCVVVLLILIFPYSLRLLLALFINVFFNRAKIYFNYLGMTIGKPFYIFQMSVVYFVIIGVYAILAKLFTKPKPGLQKNSENEGDLQSYYFQS